jgi:cytochrome c oxidase subunit 2
MDVTYGAVGPPGIQMIDDAGGTVDPAAIANNQFDASETFREPGVYQVGENQYAVYVVARQFVFAPGSSEAIQVPANSRVTFYVTSADVIHGFSLVGTNVNAMVIPGQVTKMTVEFGEPTTYGIVCNEYCGSGHHTMAGTVEVVPSDGFTAQGGAA